MSKTKTARSPEEWKTLIKEARSSDESISHWCRDHGIVRRSFYMKEKELFPQEANEEPFFELKEFSEPTSEPQRTDRSIPETVIQYGDFNIMISSNTSEEILARVLKVIRNA